MARIMDSVRSICLISTFDTLMPHDAVCTSSDSRTSRLSFSRSASMSSSWCLPSTERNVVWASWLVALKKSLTSMMALAASTMRK
ncbi:hypothetical protein D3C85_206320 [compost metagenome]